MTISEPNSTPENPLHSTIVSIETKLQELDAQQLDIEHHIDLKRAELEHLRTALRQLRAVQRQLGAG